MLRRSIVVLLGFATAEVACEMNTNGEGSDSDTDTDTDDEDDEEDDEKDDAEDDDETDSEETGDSTDSDTGSDTDTPTDTGTGSDTGTDTETDTDETDTDDTDTDDTDTDDGGTDDTGTGDTGTDTDGTDTDDTDTDDTDTDDTDTDTDTDTDEPECTQDTECSGRTPYCEENACVGCENLTMSTCADKDPTAPVCRQDGGVCVECTDEHDDLCREQGMVCGESNICRGCMAHSECVAGCDFETARCLPDDSLLLVDNDTCTMGYEDGSESMPFCTIGAAVAAVASDGTAGIRVQGNVGLLYVETVTVNSGKTVVLMGEDGPRIQAVTNPALSVAGGARLLASGFELGEGSTSIGVDCNDGTVWIDDSEVAGNADSGLNAQDCVLRLRRTTVTDNGLNGVNVVGGGTLDLQDTMVSDNVGWGVSVSAATVTASGSRVLRNEAGGISLAAEAGLTMHSSVIGRNGDDLAATRGLSVADSTADLTYVTIAAADGNDASKSIGCTAATVSVRNSIVVAEETDTVTCPGITVTSSAVQDLDILAGNENVGTWNASWFANAAMADFHLGAAASDFTDVALWLTGDPATDIDGEARPSTNESSDWPGADVP